MQIFRNLSISWKLGIAFALVVAVSIFVGVYSLMETSKISRELNNMNENWMPGLKAAADVRFRSGGVRRNQALYILATTASDRADALRRVNEEVEALRTAIEALRTQVHTPEHKANFATYEKEWNAYFASNATMMEAIEQDDVVGASRALRGDSTKHFRAAGEAITRLVEDNMGSADASVKAGQALYAAQRRNTVIVVVAGAIGSAAIAVCVAMMIVRPLRMMAGAAHAISQGDIDQQISFSAKDEVGRLADAFRGMIGYIKEIASAADKLAGGDLTAQVTARSDKDVLSHSFQKAFSSLSSTIAGIAESTTTLASASEELSATSTQMGANAEETSAQANVVSAAAEQVSKNIQTVATAAEEMSASIKEISKNASEAARVATDAVKVADTANTTVSKLGDSSQEIGNVIKLITSIAQQTNLLALNATIEAARAGEAGKGFAVVANEVKELAKETTKATEDISQKIAAIQGDTQGAVEAIKQIGQVINQVNDISNTIASAVEEQTATTNEMGRNLSEASKGSSEIAQNITGVAQAAQSTSGGATQTQSAAGELSKMSTELQTLVGRFKFESAANQAPSIVKAAPVARRPLAKAA